jgi:hypothetical protein
VVDIRERFGPTLGGGAYHGTGVVDGERRPQAELRLRKLERRSDGGENE